MAITPADIEKKTFSTALRGYDLDEVDDFLDEMVVAVRELEGELTQARARVAELERDPNAPAPAPVVSTGPDESAVGRALVAAQVAADRLLEEAQAEAERKLSETNSEADRILEGARTEADTFAKDRDEKKAAIEAEMAQLTSLVSGVRTRLAMLATSVADKLDEMDAVVAGSIAAESALSETEAVDAESAEVLDFSSEDESGYATIDLADDEPIQALVGERPEDPEDDDNDAEGDDAELDLAEVDEDEQVGNLEAGSAGIVGFDSDHAEGNDEV